MEQEPEQEQAIIHAPTAAEIMAERSSGCAEEDDDAIDATPATDVKAQRIVDPTRPA